MLGDPKPVIPENDKFLSDPTNLHYQIKCVECKRGLWEQKILSVVGNRPAATETKPCSPAVPAFKSNITICPLCKKQFFARNRKGEQLYLLTDLTSGITRLA